MGLKSSVLIIEEDCLPKTALVELRQDWSAELIPVSPNFREEPRWVFVPPINLETNEKLEIPSLPRWPSSHKKQASLYHPKYNSNISDIYSGDVTHYSQQNKEEVITEMIQQAKEEREWKRKQLAHQWSSKNYLKEAFSTPWKKREQIVLNP